MPVATLLGTETFGLVKPASDAHTLGLASVASLLAECGYRAIIADPVISATLEHLGRPMERDRLIGWLRDHGISRLGLSYRLDPRQGVVLLGTLRHALSERKFFAEQGGPIRCLYFAGLPEACRLVRNAFGPEIETFDGEESDGEALRKLGVPAARIPALTTSQAVYDEDRLRFGSTLVASGAHEALQPPDRSGYRDFGTPRDSIAARLTACQSGGQPPLLRAHAGAYSPDRAEALRQFVDWTRRLAASGWLDVLSIGTSQLTQSRFGENWGEALNGGGVPINSPDDYRSIRDAAYPMLVRTYAGTRDVPALARMHEETLNIAWHAFSLWWFSQLDGRGPNNLLTNLREHVQAMRYAAVTGKPVEPNVSHHFAFRGADDVAYVLSAALAARTAKRLGVRHLILQVMLNTPRRTWGIQDLAKARATLRLVREIEDASFRVTLQPRAGLDYFSVNSTKAKAQLAAVTALMDDIEPECAESPPIIHVVSHSEAVSLATPEVIVESLRITHAALHAYRRLRTRGEIENMAQHAETEARTTALYTQARNLLGAFERLVPQDDPALALHRALSAGFLPVPHLWGCRDEFPAAVAWQTRFIGGGVVVTDDQGRPLAIEERVATCAAALANLPTVIGGDGGLLQ